MRDFRASRPPTHMCSECGKVSDELLYCRRCEASTLDCLLSVTDCLAAVQGPTVTHCSPAHARSYRLVGNLGCLYTGVSDRKRAGSARDRRVRPRGIRHILLTCTGGLASLVPSHHHKGHDSWHLSEQAKGGQEWNALYVSSNGATHLLFHSQDWRAQKAVTAERFLCVTNVLEGPMGRSLKCLRAQVCVGGSVHVEPSTDVKDEDQATCIWLNGSGACGLPSPIYPVA